MLRRRSLFYSAVAAMLSMSGLARADERWTPLAISGNWAAMAHQPSMIAPPDVCLVADVASGMALRADADGVELRMANKEWSLPAGVAGNIVISVGNWEQVFPIDGNTNVMVSAEVPQDVIDTMFAAMDKSVSMTVVVGNAKPMQVSLSGSTRATNAFRTCAGIKGTAGSPGSNPFQ